MMAGNACLTQLSGPIWQWWRIWSHWWHEKQLTKVSGLNDGGGKQLLRGRKIWTSPKYQLSLSLSHPFFHSGGADQAASSALEVFFSSRLPELIFLFHWARSFLCCKLAVFDNPRPKSQNLSLFSLDKLPYNLSKNLRRRRRLLP